MINFVIMTGMSTVKNNVLESELETMAINGVHLGALKSHGNPKMKPYIFMVRNGIHILENLYLEELGKAGVVTFAFVCLPLKLVGATGSPVRPIAVVQRP